MVLQKVTVNLKIKLFQATKRNLGKAVFIFLLAFYSLNLLAQSKVNSTAQQRRFFSASSFWNQAIPDNPEIDPQNEHFITLLKKECSGAFFRINLTSWTIPV